MRTRLSVILLVLALGAFAVPFASPAIAAVQENDAQPEDTDNSGEDASEAGGDQEEEGQSQPQSETGASEDQTAEGAESAETGPPWTYQMSKIILGAILLLGLGIAYLYFRLVIQRQRGVV